MQKATVTEKQSLDFAKVYSSSVMSPVRNLVNQGHLEKASSVFFAWAIGKPKSVTTFMRLVRNAREQKEAKKAIAEGREAKEVEPCRFIRTITRTVRVRKQEQVNFARTYAEKFIREELVSNRKGKTEREIRATENGNLQRRLGMLLVENKVKNPNKLKGEAREAYKELVQKSEEKIEDSIKKEKAMREKENNVQHVRHVEIKQIYGELYNYCLAIYNSFRDSDSLGSSFSTKSKSHIARISPKDIVSDAVMILWEMQIRKHSIPSDEECKNIIKHLFLQQYELSKKFSSIEEQIYEDKEASEQYTELNPYPEIENKDLSSGYDIPVNAIIGHAIVQMPWNR